MANPLMDNDWADQEKTRQWVEKHREEGWGHRERAEKAGSDSMSVISLKTIASDLEKFDSVEHLGNLSDVGSIIGEEKEAENDRGFKVYDKIVEREVVNLSRQDAEKGASETDRQQRDRDRESFVKQHHRSVSLWGNVRKLELPVTPPQSWRLKLACRLPGETLNWLQMHQTENILHSLKGIEKLQYNIIIGYDLLLNRYRIVLICIAMHHRNERLISTPHFWPSNTTAILGPET